MKNLFLLFIIAILSYSSIYSQTRKSSTSKKIDDKNTKKVSSTASKLEEPLIEKKVSEEKEVKAPATKGFTDVLSESSGEIDMQNSKKNSASTSAPSIPLPANTSAIAHGEARTPTAAVAKNYKYKAEEKSVEYYNELRKKFEEEEKIRKEKEAQLAIENAKKEEEVKQGRRLSEDQAPQFEKYRQGEKNPIVKKTTAEEDYNSLFK